MKKVMIPIFSCLLVCTLLLGSFGSAKAAVGDDPVVTPVSGDMDFTTEVVSIAHLPGSIELDQMLIPVGFPEGEAQFGGNGVRVSGMDSGKATACFTISGTNYGWGGKVGVWNGTKWVLLPTSITTTGSETLSTTACAAIIGNGTYAFIKWVAEPDKLPVSSSCGYEMEFWLDGHSDFNSETSRWEGVITEADFWSDDLEVGMYVTMTWLYSVPADALILEGTGEGVLFEYSPGVYGVIFTTPVPFSQALVSGAEWYFDFTFNGCHQFLSHPDDYYIY